MGCVDEEKDEETNKTKQPGLRDTNRSGNSEDMVLFIGQVIPDIEWEGDGKYEKRPLDEQHDDIMLKQAYPGAEGRP